VQYIYTPSDDLHQGWQGIQISSMTTTYPVSRKVNSPRNDSPDLTEEVQVYGRYSEFIGDLDCKAPRPFSGRLFHSLNLLRDMNRPKRDDCVRLSAIAVNEHLRLLLPLCAICGRRRLLL